jgi:hypothetical protein
MFEGLVTFADELYNNVHWSITLGSSQPDLLKGCISTNAKDEPWLFNSNSRTRGLNQ